MGVSLRRSCESLVSTHSRHLRAVRLTFLSRVALLLAVLALVHVFLMHRSGPLLCASLGSSVLVWAALGYYRLQSDARVAEKAIKQLEASAERQDLLLKAARARLLRNAQRQKEKALVANQEEQLRENVRFEAQNVSCLDSTGRSFKSLSSWRSIVSTRSLKSFGSKSFSEGRGDGKQKKRNLFRRVLRRKSRPQEDSSTSTAEDSNSGISAIAFAASPIRDEFEGSRNRSEFFAQKGDDQQLEKDDPFTVISFDVQIPKEEIMQPNVPKNFEEFKKRLADVDPATMKCLEGKYGGEIRLYDRYLRARDFDLDAAEKMFRETLQFRQERQLDDPEGDKNKRRLEAFSMHRSKWPGNFLAQTTRDGSPIQLFRFKELRPKQLMRETKEEEFADVYVSWMEQTLDIQNRANSKQLQRKYDNDKGEHEWRGFVELHDLKGVGFSQLYLPGILMLTRILKVGQGHYPENLRAAFICNAPYFFSGSWAIISRILDPDTVEKINVSSGVPRKKMTQFFDEDFIDEIFGPTK